MKGYLLRICGLVVFGFGVEAGNSFVGMMLVIAGMILVLTGDR